MTLTLEPTTLAAAADAVTTPRILREAPAHDSAAMRELRAWVDEAIALTQPDAVHWVEGGADEHHGFLEQLVAEGTLIKLNPAIRPDSYLARSHPSDVARVESRTFIASLDPADAGPTNNWAEPVEMRRTLTELMRGSMRGRTLYVVPFSMGPIGGEMSRLGVQLTDSLYAVTSIDIMTRVGDAVTALIADGQPWVRTLHSIGAPLEPGQADVAWPCNDDKYIVHFPDSLEVFSYGSGYGGNAILAKKCFALRIASVIARREGWLAEHMLLIRAIDPAGTPHHIAAAFPSACGKTNLAMLRPTLPGWTIETLGDDIAWLQPGDDGRLWAINPEAGFFGVAPGTSPDTNAAAIETLWGNTLFTNVALTPDGDVWWEGLTETAPQGLIDWQGRPWTPGGAPAAHPNSRFAVSAAQCPQISPDWQTAVPLDVVIFGGRRASNVPLVVEARDWTHGVFMGATIASERTAAAEGTVGELRRDPFAMLPFCGYHIADYFAHWLQVGQALTNPPKFYQVNWFRKGADGRFLWPGYGDNSRVIDWIARRLAGGAAVVDSPIGGLPVPGELNLDGLDLAEGDLAALFEVDPAAWLAEADSAQEFFDGFGDKLPAALADELNGLRGRLEAAAS